MSQNPFQAPSAPTMDAGVQTAFTTTGKFDIGKCFSDAWARLWPHFGVMLGVTIVGFIVMLVAYITILGIFLVIPVLGWGLTRFMLNGVDDKPEFGDLFSGFSVYGQALVSMLAYGICYTALVLPPMAVYGVGIAAKSPAIMGVGMLVLMVWMYGFMVRFYFAPFFMVDQGMGAVDAMKAAWNATKDQKLNVFLLALLSGIVVLIGELALLIGLFAAMPMFGLMWASAYRQITGTGASR